MWFILILMNDNISYGVIISFKIKSCLKIDFLELLKLKTYYHYF